MMMKKKKMILKIMKISMIKAHEITDYGSSKDNLSVQSKKIVEPQDLSSNVLIVK